jgi:hypothetical protein
LVFCIWALAPVLPSSSPPRILPILSQLGSMSSLEFAL